MVNSAFTFKMERLFQEQSSKVLLHRRRILISDQNTMEDTSLYAAEMSTIAIEIKRLRL
jgi:hypothetical protein